MSTPSREKCLPPFSKVTEVSEILFTTCKFEDILNIYFLFQTQNCSNSVILKYWSLVFEIFSRGEKIYTCFVQSFVNQYLIGYAEYLKT